jgi:DNA-directed RNA polymerase subunit M/transcription elongation factor TFIIS
MSSSQDFERSVAKENPNFNCRKCNSGDLWYRITETFDGAYDIHHYHCHQCGHRWSVTLEYD